MKNRTLLILSLILIAFLIGNSYAPSGTTQTVMAQESDPYEGLMDFPEFEGKGTLITGTKEEMYQQQDSVTATMQRYIVPGFAFKRSSDKPASDNGSLYQGWLGHGRANYTNEDMEKSVEIHYPVHIPESSMIYGIDVCGTIVYRVEPHKKLSAHLFRFHWDTEEMQTIASATLNDETDGTDCAHFILDEPHFFDPFLWNYQLVVSLNASYAGKNVYDLSQVILFYEPPATLFPLAFPAIQK